jgi:phage terminase large subunit-like protein
MARTTSTKADEVAGWIQRNCAHVKGEWAGQKLELQPWQREIIDPLFGTVAKDGRRQYRTALIGIPRKAGKSTLGAALALRLLFRDGEPGAEVYSAAADRDQAAIVFEIARGMVEANAGMAKLAKVYRRSIVVPRTGSTYKVLSADAYTKHGLSPHGVIFDELHAQPNRELWDVLTTGQGARRQPLTIAITTAGYDRESICWELYDYGRKVQAGVIDDPTFFFRWWGVEADEDWEDEEVWERAQPNLGISVSREFLRSEARQAKHQPARQNTFRRLYLNGRLGWRRAGIPARGQVLLRWPRPGVLDGHRRSVLGLPQR